MLRQANGSTTVNAAAATAKPEPQVGWQSLVAHVNSVLQEAGSEVRKHRGLTTQKVCTFRSCPRSQLTNLSQRVAVASTITAWERTYAKGMADFAEALPIQRSGESKLAKTHSDFMKYQALLMRAPVLDEEHESVC